MLLHYQPIFEINSEKMISVEALLRFHENDDSFNIPPPFRSKVELTLSATEWVIDTACRQNKEWECQGLGPIKISINLPESHLRQNQILRITSRLLEKYQIKPGGLEFEIPMTFISADTRDVINIFNQIHKIGVGITLDNFEFTDAATGLLEHFAISKVKINRTFIKNIINDHKATDYLEKLITFAHAAGLKTIGVGVESSQQALFLHKFGCDEIQGYYICKPINAEFFSKLALEFLKR